MKDTILPGLPFDRILARYADAPGNEVESGKFANPESSAALAANAFGMFLERPADLPPLPGCESLGWPADGVELEVVLRFPWSGGRHPCLDAAVTTRLALIGVESKRYEPFRPRQGASLSEAYLRPVWGNAMKGFERARDGLRGGDLKFVHLDASQLVKHAFGLRTAVHKQDAYRGKLPVLFYLYAEPSAWPDKRRIDPNAIAAHRAEIADFAAVVAGDEVIFKSAPYGEVLKSWRGSPVDHVRSHASAMTARFNLE